MDYVTFSQPSADLSSTQVFFQWFNALTVFSCKQLHFMSAQPLMTHTFALEGFFSFFLNLVVGNFQTFAVKVKFLSFSPLETSDFGRI